MKKKLIRHLLHCLPALLVSCSMFGPVDPLAPTISQPEVVDVRRTEITISGVIDKPDFKNDRQEKKSGNIMEYGLVFGTTQNLDIQTNSVVKLGLTGTLPISIQSQKISGLASNTQYYVAIYARNEGGGIAYSPVVNVKTTDQPGIFTSKVNVKLAAGSGVNYDLDEGKTVAKGDAEADVSFDIFTITGRGTVLTLNPLSGTVFKNNGIVDFNGVTYLKLLNTTDYNAEAIALLMNTTTANTVIGFRTKDGRLGKWRIESLTVNELAMSLVTYDK